MVPLGELGRAGHRQRLPRAPARRASAITFDFHDFGPYRTRWRLDGNRYQGNPYWFDGTAHPETVVQTEDGTLRHVDRPEGVLRPAWNARIS